MRIVRFSSSVPITVLFICCCYGFPLKLSSSYHIPGSHLSHKSGQIDRSLAGHTSGQRLSRSTSGDCAPNLNCQDRRNCENGGTCYTINTSCAFSCFCPQFYSGDRCQYQDIGQSPSNEPILGDYIPNQPPETTEPVSNSSDIENSTMKEIVCMKSNRSSHGCPRFFPCVHGTCPSPDHNVTNEGEPIIPRFTCICDPGWSGPQCDQCCPLDCGNGSCVQENGTLPSCDCFWGYKGPRCETFDAKLKEKMENGTHSCFYKFILKMIN